MSRTPTWRVFRDGEWGPMTAQDAAADAERIRKLAQTYDPMEDGFWTPWQAFAWIRHLDKDKVRECSKSWLTLRPGWGFEEFWGDVSTDYEAIRAWNKGLMRALQSGRLPSSGTDVATGNRCDIDALKWLDLRLNQICCEPSGRVIRRELGEVSVITDYLDPRLAEIVPPAKAGPQFYHKNKRFDGLTLPEPDFRDVLFRVADALRVWQPPKVREREPDRKRGRRAVKAPEILAAMRKTDPEELLDMTEEAMAVTYGAARSTCRGLRKKVLAN
jgi:hypothetical protein